MSEKPTHQFVDPRYAKGTDYGKVLNQIQTAGVCPFCPDTFKWHTKPILQRTLGWLITRNMNPYAGTREHFLIVGKKHVENILDLSPRDMTAILRLAQWAVVEYQLPGALLAMRFGDKEFTGATVTHLHAHLIVPEKIDDRVTVVNFPIG